MEDNTEKTIYVRFNEDGNFDGNSDINLQGENLERVNTFKYLGATLAENGDLDTQHKIQPVLFVVRRPKNVTDRSAFVTDKFIFCC